MQQLKRALSLLIIPFLVACGPGEDPKPDGDKKGGGDKPAPRKALVVGAESPKALMTRLDKAIKAGDEADLRACVTPADEEVRDLVVRVLLAADRFHQLLTKAKEKFGGKGVQDLGQAGGFLVFMRNDFAEFAAKGVVTEKGDTAEVKISKSENGGTSSKSVNAVKLDGRWVLGMGGAEDKAKVEKQNAQMEAMLGPILPPLSTLMDTAEPAVDSSKDEAEFNAAIKDALETAKKKIKAAQEAMRNSNKGK